MNKIICAAGFLGFSAIALGAYSDHGLRGTIDESALRSLETAIRYQLIHALALLGIGLFLQENNAHTAFHNKISYAAIAMLLGTLIFCGSIYVKNLAGLEFAANFAPLGGMTLMAAWLMILWTGCIKKSAP